MKSNNLPTSEELLLPLLEYAEDGHDVSLNDAEVFFKKFGSSAKTLSKIKKDLGVLVFQKYLVSPYPVYSSIEG